MEQVDYEVNGIVIEVEEKDAAQSELRMVEYRETMKEWKGGTEHGEL